MADYPNIAGIVKEWVWHIGSIVTAINLPNIGADVKSIAFRFNNGTTEKSLPESIFRLVNEQKRITGDFHIRNMTDRRQTASCQIQLMDRY